MDKENQARWQNLPNEASSRETPVSNNLWLRLVSIPQPRVEDDVGQPYFQILDQTYLFIGEVICQSPKQLLEFV
jgi:hypothetical protein